MFYEYNNSPINQHTYTANSIRTVAPHKKGNSLYPKHLTSKTQPLNEITIPLLPLATQSQL